MGPIGPWAHVAHELMGSMSPWGPCYRMFGTALFLFANKLVCLSMFDVCFECFLMIRYSC